ncbi:M20/M25/M40 family metallo-hydrolase [Dictyobacter kobayashii]|uniref:Peptidase M20 n=1 Tax=Dictyobacter kobayashii TaxID=2014872 RepID=A0A402ARK5_9CHLR|nr:M20/M25/M40 family metallo-hydrolase [Dictyobacter kobayashii]GCE21724.1 peptidase M20 [Dictyobacter kobayashii]
MSETRSSTMAIPDLDTLAAEAVRHLQALLRCQTVNLPGNEYLAVDYLRSQLEQEAGIEIRILEPAPGRQSIWARVRGSGAQRPLLLLSHTDVVPVERDHWTVDPFSGEIHNGYIYGRGAADMKQMTAMELTLLLHMARQVREGGPLPGRDIILLAVADEERSGTWGMRWVVENMPELVDAEYALNEGGGFAFELGGQRLYVCETAQKGCAHITLRASGTPGHGSVPHNDNAIARLARAIRRLHTTPLPMHVTPTTRTFLQALAATQTRARGLLLQQVLNPALSEMILKGLEPGIANPLRAMLHNTASPTILQAGTAGAINVIPSEATVQLDGRNIPGQTPEAFEREIRNRIADPKIAITLEQEKPGHELPSATPLFTALNAAIAAADPGASVVPYLLPAVSDSSYLAARGVICYGFIPTRPEPGLPSPHELAHGHDERVSVANIQFGMQVLTRTLMQLT